MLYRDTDYKGTTNTPVRVLVIENAYLKRPCQSQCLSPAMSPGGGFAFPEKDKGSINRIHSKARYCRNFYHFYFTFILFAQE